MNAIGCPRSARAEVWNNEVCASTEAEVFCDAMMSQIRSFEGISVEKIQKDLEQALPKQYKSWASTSETAFADTFWSA